MLGAQQSREEELARDVACKRGWRKGFAASSKWQRFSPAGTSYFHEVEPKTGHRDK